MRRFHFPEFKFPFYYGWVIVGAAFAEHLFSVGLHNSQGVFFKPILAEFGWNRAMLSGAFSLYTLMMGLLAPIAGALADRYGPGRLIVFEAFFVAIGFFLLSQAGSLWHFYVIYIVFIGVGKSAGQGSIVPTIPRWFEAKRGLSQGIVQAGGGLGTVIMPIFIAHLILNNDWRLAYIVAGVISGIGLLIIAILYKRRPQDMGLQPDGRTNPSNGNTGGQAETKTLKFLHGTGKGLTLRQALRTRALWQLFAISMMAAFGHQLITIHLVPHATDKGFSTATAATFMSVLGVTNILGKLTMGTVSDYIGRQKAMIIAFSLAIAMLFWLIVAEELWAFYLFAALFGFAYAGWMPLFPTLTADLFGVASLGAIYGVVNASNAIGGALGTFLGGYIFDVTQSYVTAFISAAVLLVIGIVLILTLRPPEKQVV